MPFEKNYPELGPTRRLRIPDQVAPHLESVLEHLDRQTQRLGQNYIKAFFAQCTQIMRELEASCPSNTNNLSDKLNQEAIRQHLLIPLPLKLAAIAIKHCQARKKSSPKIK